ncbi:hypothetical protein DFH27DRAFT_583912 [Peziza echinospora]|nr:hypothetical protein DFH27DRAFT_583912 [Peziza echinospora]
MHKLRPSANSRSIFSITHSPQLNTAMPLFPIFPRQMARLASLQRGPAGRMSFGQMSMARSSRRYSSQVPDPLQPESVKTSPHVGFYQMYGRTLAKLILVSLITYQGVYLSWLYLGFEEEKEKTKAQLALLEEEASTTRVSSPSPRTNA